MAKTPPIVKNGILTCLQDGSSAQVEVGSSDWYAWLETAASYVFQSEHGSFTARQERAGNRRGNPYWRAYCTREGKLRRVYLGGRPVLLKAEDAILDDGGRFRHRFLPSATEQRFRTVSHQMFGKQYSTCLRIPPAEVIHIDTVLLSGDTLTGAFLCFLFPHHLSLSRCAPYGAYGIKRYLSLECDVDCPLFTSHTVTEEFLFCSKA